MFRGMFLFYAVPRQTDFKIQSEVHLVWLVQIQPTVLFILYMHHVSLAEFEIDVATYLSLGGYFINFIALDKHFRA